MYSGGFMYVVSQLHCCISSFVRTQLARRDSRAYPLFTVAELRRPLSLMTSHREDLFKPSTSAICNCQTRQSQTVLLLWWEPKETLLQTIPEKFLRRLGKGQRWNKTRRKEGQEAALGRNLSSRQAQKPVKMWRMCLILF